MNLDKLPGPMPESTLAKIILSEHPKSLVKVLVHGKERIGKSMYVIHVLWEIFEALGYDEDEAYNMAFNSLYLKPKKFLGRLDEIRVEREKAFENQAHALVLDDAGVPLGGGLYQYDRDTYWAIREQWPRLGTLVTGMFLTTPTPDDIGKQFKGWSYRVKIVPRPQGGEYGRCAWVYAEDTDALGIHWYATSEGGFKENFSCYVPDKWYKPYDTRRVKLTERANRFSDTKDSSLAGTEPRQDTHERREDLSHTDSREPFVPPESVSASESE